MHSAVSRSSEGQPPLWFFRNRVVRFEFNRCLPSWRASGESFKYQVSSIKYQVPEAAL